MASASWVDHRGAMAGLEARRRRRRGTARLVVGLSGLAIVLVLAAVVAAVAVMAPATFEVRASSADPTVTQGSLPPGWDAEDGEGGMDRLRPMLELPADIHGQHNFLQSELDDDPVAWDPCEPIRYVVNPRSAPPGAEEILDRAITAVENASGLVFEKVGTTDEEPPLGERTRLQQDPERYGEGWSPVLIAWTDVATDPWLEGYAGVAQAIAVPYGGGEAVYVTGTIRLLGDYATEVIEAGYEDAIVGVAMHELGHLLGLGHVGDPNEVMNDLGGELPPTWGPGDRAGLAVLGAGDCAPQI